MKQEQQAVDEPAVAEWFNKLPLTAPTLRACDRCGKLTVSSLDSKEVRYHYRGECVKADSKPIDVRGHFGTWKCQHCGLTTEHPQSAAPFKQCGSMLGHNFQPAVDSTADEPSDDLCRLCFKPLADTTMVGCGDGSGRKFMHRDCWSKHQASLDQYENDKAEPQGKPELSLSLLIVDFGESCVLRIENSVYPDVQRLLKGFNVKWPRRTVDPFVVEHSLADIRSAIDALEGEKPVPRIERDDDGGCRIIMPDDNLATGTLSYFLKPQGFDALSELAGKPLPIYKAGEWMQLQAGVGAFQTDLPFTAWRYTRQGETDG